MKNFLLSVMLFTMLCTSFAFAEIAKPTTYKCDDFYYILHEDGTAEITGYARIAEELEIPTELDGNRVTTISSNAFSAPFNLTSITIPDSVIEIGENPFSECPKLTDIRVSPDSPALAVMDGVLFSKLDKRLVCYPSGLMRDSYEIPEGIRSIGSYAFCNNDYLTSITIPDTVIEIGKNPFSLCSDLTDIHVSPNSPMLAVIDGVLFSKYDKKLICYPCGFEKTAYEVPIGVRTIGSSAFSGCHNLVNITIPDSVIEIGDMAFLSCRNLDGITIPDSVIKIGTCAFIYCFNLVSIEISNNITEIGERTFDNCINLIDITIPDSVTKVGYRTFFRCVSLANVTLPVSMTTIDPEAFAGCKSLTNVTIPDGVVEIGARAFGGCENLTDVTIPDSVVEIGSGVFNGCGNLTITVGHDSPAEQFAAENDIRYIYPDSMDWLHD